MPCGHGGRETEGIKKRRRIAFADPPAHQGLRAAYCGGGGSSGLGFFFFSGGVVPGGGGGAPAGAACGAGWCGGGGAPMGPVIPGLPPGSAGGR